MVESPRRVDLRLTISVHSPYRELAGELADKFAEYAGLSGKRKADVVETVLRSVDACGSEGEVEIEMTAEAGNVSVIATRASAPQRSK
jgi:hypothetical protein